MTGETRKQFDPCAPGGLQATNTVFEPLYSREILSAAQDAD